MRIEMKSASSYLALTLFFTLATSFPAAGQFSDEIWLETNEFDRADDPTTNNNCGLDSAAETIYGLRSDWLDVLLDETDWPSVFARTDVFAIHSTLLTSTLLPNDPANGSGLKDLVGFMVTNDIGISVDGRPFFIDANICDPSNFNGNEPLFGEETATDFAPDYYRLVDQCLVLAGETGSGVSEDDCRSVFYSFSSDHAISYALRAKADVDPALDCLDTMSVADFAKEIGDFVTTLTAQTNTLVYTDYPHLEPGTGEPDFFQQPLFGMWEAAAFKVVDPLDSTVWPQYLNVEATDLEDVIKDVAAEVELSYFFIDQSPCGVCWDARYDGDPNDVDCDPTTLEPVADWQFGRIVAIERMVRSLAEETSPIHVQVGNANHLGPRAIQSGATDEEAYQLFTDYTEGYLAAGGNPDILPLYAWQNYPSKTGPQTEPLSYMNIARDVLDQHYPEPLYVDEDFQDPNSPTYHALTGNSKWDDVRGQWEYFTSGSAKTLHQNWCSSPPSDCADGLGHAQLNLEDEQMRSFELDVKIKLEEGNMAGNGWAGVHLRKQAPADLPWSPSGYLVHLSEKTVGNDDWVMVTLYAKDSGGAVILNRQETTALPATGNSGWNRLRVRIEDDSDASGKDRIRVTVCQAAQCEVDVIDERDDTWPGNGYLALLTNHQDAKYDDLKVRQLLPYTPWCSGAGGCGDDFTHSGLASWNLVQSWSVVNQALVGSSGFAVWNDPSGETRRRYQAAVDAVVPATGWVGLQFGQTQNNAGVADSGLMVKLHRVAGTTRLELVTGPDPVSIVDGGNAVATLSAGAGETVRIGARVTGHLVEVFADGERVPELSGDWLFDGLASGFIDLQPGFVGLATSGPTGQFDGFVLIDYDPVP